MWSTIKTILIPASIALALYLTLHHALLPLWRAHRQRYSHYLPLHNVNVDLDSLHNRTSSLRRSASRLLYAVFIPASMRGRLRDGDGAAAEGDDDSDGEEGEGLAGLDHHQDGGRAHLGVDGMVGDGRLGAGRDATALPLTGLGTDRTTQNPWPERTGSRRQVGGDQPYATSDNRLNRDLEAGFMDSSDEEDAGEVEGRGDRLERERWRANG